MKIYGVFGNRFRALGDWGGGRRAAAEESPADRLSIAASIQLLIPPRAEAIRLALRELGYIEGQSIAIEYRYAEGKARSPP